jgi:PAS domain S-box-containing protein
VSASDDPSHLTQARLDALGAHALPHLAGPAEREQVLALAERSAGIGVWDVDLQTGVAHGTAQFFRIYGLEPTDAPVPIEVMRAMRHPDDRQRVVDGFRHAIASGAETYEAEYRVVRPDGEVRWVFGRGRVVRDADGTPRRYSGVDIDITERKQAEAALAESEARLALAQEAAGVGIWDLDLGSGRFSWSTQQYRLHGLSPGPAPTLDDWRNAVHPADRARAHATIMAAVAQAAPYEDAYRIALPEGRLRWVTAKGRVVLGDAGRPVRMLGVAYDETARREAIEALARLNAELEVRVEQRTAELVQLQKLETLGQLTGGIAHDFNNVLSIVLGSLRLLRKRFDHPEGALRLIDAAIQGAQRGADLTKRLLAFARRQELASGPIDLAELVRGTSDLLRRSLGPEVRIELDLPAGLPPARADASQLDVAVLNLAVNARDAMPLGGTLTMRGRCERVGTGHATGLAPGDYVVLEVIDTGQGMDAATLARACEPFFTTKGVGKGTGLGLAMVHGFAAQSGGALRLASQPDRGTTAAIWLPVAADARAARALEGEAPRPPQLARGLRVLAVDDDSLVLLGTVEQLKDLGHEVIEAASGEAALAMLHTGVRVDLVVADQAMPGMTGLELAAAITAAWPGLPVLLATGYAELPDGVAPLPPRITKPFTQEVLAAAIDRLFGAEPGNVVRLRPPA